MHNLEIGGSNYTGFSLTTEYRFKLYDQSNLSARRFHLSPKLGIGHIFFWDKAMTFQGGLAFGLETRWGDVMELNTNFSYLHFSPFKFNNDCCGGQSPRYTVPYELGSILWYTGVDYRFEGKLNYTLGLGVMSMFHNDMVGSESNYELEGDFIPMLKLGIGL